MIAYYGTVLGCKLIHFGRSHACVISWTYLSALIQSSDRIMLEDLGGLNYCHQIKLEFKFTT